MLKQQGVDVKGMTKGSQMTDEIPPLLESGGKLEVSFIFFRHICTAVQIVFVSMTF